MGYDMYWVGEASEEEQAAYELAHKRFEEAVAIRDRKFPREAEVYSREQVMQSPEQKAVEAAGDAMYTARVWYFRLNGWGMSLCRDLMKEREMLSYAEPLEFPKLDQFGLADWPDEDEDYEPGSPELAYIEATREVLAHEYGGVIPAHKLSDNSGWLVTPAEIRASLEAWRANGADREVTYVEAETSYAELSRRLDSRAWRGKSVQEFETKAEPVSWWPRWIDWLAAAAEHGGFRVY